MIHSEKKSTKELILDVAFSFYTEGRCVDFSMNELAAKVGISKPAIYRHFKNKDDVLEGMLCQFIEKLSVPLLKIQENKKDTQESVKVPFSEAITFFAENPEYLNYFIDVFYEKREIEDIFREKLQQYGLNDENYFKSKLIVDFYCGLTIVFFLKAREKKFSSICAKTFSDKLIDFILNGFEGSSLEDDLIHPILISEKRIRELNEICKIKKDEFPSEDRMFIALAKVICEHSMKGVTLEKIANEMNLAKSSLYFYFDNKNQLIKSQIEKEISILSALCIENGAEAKTFSEFIYIMMRTEIEYFRLRPSVIPICGWLVQNSGEMPFGKEDGFNNIWEKKIGKVVRPDFGVEYGAEMLTFWVGIIPVAFMPFSKRHNLTDKEIDDSIKEIFSFIQFGLK